MGIPCVWSSEAAYLAEVGCRSLKRRVAAAVQDGPGASAAISQLFLTISR